MKFSRFLGAYHCDDKRIHRGPEPGGKYWSVDPNPWGPGRRELHLDGERFFARHKVYARVWGYVDDGHHFGRDTAWGDEVSWVEVPNEKALIDHDLETISVVTPTEKTMMTWPPEFYCIKKRGPVELAKAA